ncbi:MAG: hypothetical protein ABI480_10040 [Chitinophagaceae bacterium]
MKKKVKKKKSLFDYKFNLIIDKRLDKIDINNMASEKVAQANKDLKGMKIPK